MFRVSRDANCFQPDADVDENPRTSGAVELLEFFIWPGMALVLLFAWLIINNHVNIKNLSSIRKRFDTCHVVKWPMHGDMLTALNRLRKAEKLKHREFAEYGIDTLTVRKAMDEKKKAEIAILNFEKKNIEHMIQQNNDGVFLTNRDEEKWQFKKDNIRLEVELKHLALKKKKIEKKYNPTRKHKYDGIFAKKDGGNVFWSPTDLVLYELKHRKLEQKKTKYHEVMVDSIDDIYG
ncbi:unnamed protein product [Caenorhabditis nigoni]